MSQWLAGDLSTCDGLGPSGHPLDRTDRGGETPRLPGGANSAVLRAAHKPSRAAPDLPDEGVWAHVVR